MLVLSRRSTVRRPEVSEEWDELQLRREEEKPSGTLEKSKSKTDFMVVGTKK